MWSLEELIQPTKGDFLLPAKEQSEMAVPETLKKAMRKH